MCVHGQVYKALVGEGAGPMAGIPPSKVASAILGTIGVRNAVLIPLVFQLMEMEQQTAVSASAAAAGGA